MTTMTTIEGKVTRTNGKGFQIAGRDGWLNISKYADPLDVPMPKTGDVVHLKLDKAGFIREIEPIATDCEPHPVHNSAVVEPAAKELICPDERKQQLIIRQSVLKVAAEIVDGNSSVDVADILEVAARLEAWALRS